jgi:hypothetical protein
MPYILYHEDGKVVALDESGPRLIITEWDADVNGDVLWALVDLPRNGIEVMDSQPTTAGYASGPDAEVTKITNRDDQQRPLWRHSRSA